MTEMIIILWVLLSAFISALCRGNENVNQLEIFIISLLLSPVIGVIVVIFNGLNVLQIKK